MNNVMKLHDDADTIRRIEKYIEQPPENSRVFTITPAVAEHLLATFNNHNRPKKPISISDYASSMAGGDWALTGDPLKFSNKPLLRDGQHRLMACVRSGASFKTHIVFGIDDDCFAALDRGKNRGGSDLLAIAGYSNTTRLAAAIRWAYLIDEGRAKQRDTVPPDMTLRLVTERYPHLHDFIAPASAIGALTGQPIGLVAALLHAFHRKDAEKFAEFSTGWSAGQVGGKFAVLGRLQKEIGKLSKQSSGRVHDVVRAALIVNTWNAFIEGRRGNASDFDWSPADEFPAIKG